jgi:CubicO group peptidase (beta-lactamase class C family)
MEKLALEDKLIEYLPDFPRADEITVGDLLNHSAGIPHRVTEPLDETRPQTPASMVELAARRDLVFEPGSDSVYSSAGFSVLARVLELAGGKPYTELLAEYVLRPAGMAETADSGTRAILENRAESYYFSSDGFVNAPPSDISYLVGAGSVFSTPRDLLAMQQALLDGNLGRGAQELLVRDSGNLSWNGLANGYRAFADYDAASGVSVVVASNLTSGALDKIRSALPEIAAGQDVPTPEPIKAKAADIDTEILEGYQGAYELRPGRNLELRVVDDSVMMEEWLLIPTSERTLFSPQDYAEIEVVLDEEGGVSRLDWTIGGQTYPLPKVTASLSMDSDSRASAIDAFIALFVELAMFDGNVLIDVGGEIRHERSFGFANYEHAVKNADDTKFRIASVSKTLTDAAFAVLIQRELLTLETPLAEYLPEFPSAESITISHLLNHTSGIAHTNDQPWGDGATTYSLDELIERLASLPLDFEPGSDRGYSNGGYAVAAKVLEIAGEGSFAEVMRDLVFEPLGMSNTGHIADARVPITNLSTGYEPGTRPGEHRHARFYAVETRPGGGSLYSTARDLLRFARGVFREGFLEASLVQSVLGADDGTFLAQGRSPGFVAKLFYDPTRDVIVVSLANSYAVPADWAAAIADLATGDAKVASWPAIQRSAESVAESDTRLGHYRNSRGGGELSVERSIHGEMLLHDLSDRSVTGLIPLVDGAFLMPPYYQRCEQVAEGREITCRILSGDPRYTSTWTPIADATRSADEDRRRPLP